MSKYKVTTLHGNLRAKKNLSDENGCVEAMLPLAMLATVTYGLTSILEVRMDVWIPNH